MGKNLLTLVRMSKSRSSNSLLMTATIGLVPWTLKDVLPPEKKSKSKPKSKPTVDGKYKQMVSNKTNLGYRYQLGWNLILIQYYHILCPKIPEGHTTLEDQK